MEYMSHLTFTNTLRTTGVLLCGTSNIEAKCEECGARAIGTRKIIVKRRGEVVRR